MSPCPRLSAIEHRCYRDAQPTDGSVGVVVEHGTEVSDVRSGLRHRAAGVSARRVFRGLAAAGFDEAMKTALRAEDVLCGDETRLT